MKTITLTAAALAFAATAASSATITNGSFDGTIGTASLPSGWTAISPSPDTNNQSFSGAGGTYAVAADISNDGGTWVGFGRSTGSTNEIIGQTITDFIVGEVYSLSWEAGNFGIGGYPSYSNSNAISVFLDGVSVGAGSALGVTTAWFNQSITFTATATSQLLSFGLQDDVDSYLQLDGVAIAPVSAVPIPAGGLLLLTAFGGLGLARRRRKARA
ncbi:MAG: VPLPA-CTERM sorting domain-containing protein [Octadecabacter sp.]